MGTVFWKVRAETRAANDGHRLTGYYVVAVGETADQALDALRAREVTLGDADLTIEGEVSPAVAAEFKMRPGAIFGMWEL